MKFNSEKIKKVVKKTVIGAGIIVTPIISSGQNSSNSEIAHKNIQNTEINKDKNIENNQEFYINKYIKYMEHPSYKQRLAKEMFGDVNINEAMQNIVDEEYNKRINKIYSIIIEMIPDVDNPTKDTSNFSPSNKVVTSTPRAIFHEIQHRLDNNDDNFIIRQKGFEEVKNKNIGLKTILENYNYFGRSDEIKARLNSLRIKAIMMYGFDLNTDFDINNYEKLREDKEYNELRFDLNLTNEQINELMKYIAINDKNNVDDKTYVHPGWDYGNENNKA